MALPGVNRNLANYEALRKIEVPLDTEPAIAFHPALPGKRYAGRAVKPQLSKQEIPKYNSLSEVAFFTATQLSELVRTRRVSPVELTRMYIARLKRYGPKLNCVVTLTEDLALGFFGLFETKGILTTWGAEPFRNQIIDYDATVVERLRDAGAVLVAKLSMGALAQGG